MVTTREAIAVAELIVYIPTFFVTVFIVFRHGWKRQVGWIYLAIFCVIRLAGAVFEILHTKTPTNTTYIEWALILQSVGLSPLLMSSLGLLKRLIDATSDHIPSGDSNTFQLLAGRSRILGRLTKNATANSRRSRLIQLIQLPATIALALCVIGGTDEASNSPSSQKSGKQETKAGIAMFLIIYIILFLLSLFSMAEIRKTPSGERRILLAVLVALPFIAVRLLYSILSNFSNNTTFSLVNGNAIVQLAMATAEEFVVVVIYTIMGLTLAKFDYDPPKQQGALFNNNGAAPGYVSPEPYGYAPYQGSQGMQNDGGNPQWGNQNQQGRNDQRAYSPHQQRV